MRNKSLILALAGAVVFGLIGVVLVTRYLANAQSYAKNLSSVVIAKAPIPLGSKITAEQLATAPIPNGSAPDGAFTSADKVVGRIAIVDIGLREPVTNLKLAAEGASGGLSAVIPAGYRAMTVKVDDVVGVSGFVLPGSFVDVVVVITPRGDEGGRQSPISKIVLQNIKVLANGQNIDKPKDEREASTVKAVTLQVTPEQAEKLALASSEGKLQLVLRNYGDQDDALTRGISTQALLSGDNSPVVQPTPQKAGPAKASAPRARIVIPREEPTPAPVAQATPAPPTPPRRVEAIEGAKKRSIDLPDSQ